MSNFFLSRTIFDSARTFCRKHRNLVSPLVQEPHSSSWGLSWPSWWPSILGLKWSTQFKYRLQSAHSTSVQQQLKEIYSVAMCHEIITITPCCGQQRCVSTLPCASYPICRAIELMPVADPLRSRRSRRLRFDIQQSEASCSLEQSLKSVLLTTYDGDKENFWPDYCEDGSDLDNEVPAATQLKWPKKIDATHDRALAIEVGRRKPKVLALLGVEPSSTTPCEASRTKSPIKRPWESMKQTRNALSVVFDVEANGSSANVALNLGKPRLMRLNEI
ncbi:hypothetical protein V1527DRAFT_464789 [Lipomyces starkeyi]